MKILMRLEDDRKCSGCSAIGYVEVKTQACLYCLGLRLAVQRRKRKLDETVRSRFAGLAEEVRRKLREFHAAGRV